MKNQELKKTIEELAKGSIESLETDEAGQLQGGFAAVASAIDQEKIEINFSKCHCETTPATA